jgi:hypothetical protein
MNRTLAIFSALETDFLNNSGSLRSMEGHPWYDTE